MSVRESWARIAKWFSSQGVDLKLRPPASPDRIAALQSVVGRTLPASFVESLALHDGQAADAGVTWLGGWLGSIDDIIVHYGRQHAAAPRDEEGFGLFDESERLRAVIVDRDRIAVSGMPFWTGDNVLLDFIPGPRGVEGQVIKLVSECDFVVLGASWGEMLTRYADHLEAGRIRWNEQYRLVDTDWDAFSHGG